jgi:hypothetical protein
MLRLVVSLPLAGLASSLHDYDHDGAARRKRKKSTLCLNGQTIRTKRKKKFLAQGATKGPCPPLTGTRDDVGCAVGCAANSICVLGACLPCDVTCTGPDPVACGQTLQFALATKPTVYVCPGRYAGNFSFFGNSTNVIGAGSGDNPATSTILDGNYADHVLRVDQEVTVSLQNVRVTRGTANEGGGILNTSTLTVTGCTITDNYATGNPTFAEGGGGISNKGRLTLNSCTVIQNRANAGGGIVNRDGDLTLNKCTISRNIGDVIGGGLYNSSRAIISDTAFTGNDARSAGGIMNWGYVGFTGSSSVTGNTAFIDGGGIFNNSGSVDVNTAIIQNNRPNNCGGPTPVPRCGN